MNTLIQVFEDFAKYEENKMKSNLLKDFIVARLVSILTILFITYITTFLIIYIFINIYYNFFQDTLEIEYINFSKNLAIIILMPLTLILFLNFTNKNFILSKISLEVLKIFRSYDVTLQSYKSLMKLILFSAYLSITVTLTTNLIIELIPKENLLKHKDDFMFDLFIISAIFHTAVYIIISIYFIPENTEFEKEKKLKSKLLMWFIYLVIVLLSFIIKSLDSLSMINSLYNIFFIVIAAERFINCYKELRNHLFGKEF